MTIHDDLIKLAKEFGYKFQYHSKVENKLVFTKTIKNAQIAVRIWVDNLTVQVLNALSHKCFTRHKQTLEQVWRVLETPYPVKHDIVRGFIGSEMNMFNIGKKRKTKSNGLLSDSDLMPYGKHEGKTMKNVPVPYLVWMYNNGKCSEIVKEFIVRRILK